MIEKIAARVLEKLARNRFETEYLKGNVSPQQYDSYVADPRLKTRSYSQRAIGLDKGNANMMQKLNIFDANQHQVNPNAYFGNFRNVMSGAPSVQGRTYSASGLGTALRAANPNDKGFHKFFPAAVAFGTPLALRGDSFEQPLLEKSKAFGSDLSQINSVSNRHEINEIRDGIKQTPQQLQKRYHGHVGPSILARELQDAKFTSPASRNYWTSLRRMTGEQADMTQRMGKAYDVAGDASFKNFNKMNQTYKNSMNTGITAGSGASTSPSVLSKMRDTYKGLKAVTGTFGGALLKDTLALPGQWLNNYFHGPAPLIIPK